MYSDMTTYYSKQYTVVNRISTCIVEPLNKGHTRNKSL